MQVTTLSTQFGLGSEIVDMYRDATSVPFGHLLIELSPSTNDRLRYCTNTGSNPSKFYIPDRLKQSKNLDEEPTNTLYSPSVPIIFPQMQKSFPSVLPKRVYPVSLRIQYESAQRKPAKHKKTQVANFQSEVRLLSQTFNLEARKAFCCPKKAYSSSKILLFPSLIICLDLEQFVLVPDSVYNKSLITQSVTKQELKSINLHKIPRTELIHLRRR